MSGHPDLARAQWRKSTRSADGADCVEITVSTVRRTGETPDR